VATGQDPQETQHSAVAEILSKASSLKVPEELEELTAGLLSLRARRLAPVASDEETRLLLTINAGISAELTHRAKALIEKRNDCGLTSDEKSELLQLALVWSGLTLCRDWPNSVVSRCVN
jgi:uncharacterized NAD(P)/FAD-binding protein YdhS